jgi:hypothetical protein
LFAASQPGNELKKCWINTERIGEKGRPTRQQNKKKKGKKNKGSNKNVKSGLRIDGAP